MISPTFLMGGMIAVLVGGIVAAFASTTKRLGGMSEKEVHAEYVRVMAARKAREEEQENQRQTELIDAVAAKVKAEMPKKTKPSVSRRSAMDEDWSSVGQTDDFRDFVVEVRNVAEGISPLDSMDELMSVARHIKEISDTFAFQAGGWTGYRDDNMSFDTRGSGDSSVVENELSELGESETKIGPQKHN